MTCRYHGPRSQVSILGGPVLPRVTGHLVKTVRVAMRRTNFLVYSKVENPDLVQEILHLHRLLGSCQI